MPTVELASGEQIDAELFEDLEEKLEQSDAKEFMESRLERRKKADPVTPFTSRPSFMAGQVGGTRHAERSRHAQTADESFNARIAPDYATWRENPDRYDIPGVDTIPPGRMIDRAEAALGVAMESGAVENFEEGYIAGGSSTKGRFSSAYRNITTQEREELDDEYPMFQFGPVLAHEVGHAIDRKALTDRLEADPGDLDPEDIRMLNRADAMTTKFYSEAYFADKPELREQIEGLTRRARGAYAEGSLAADWDEYRAELKEQTADALASFIIEPRAARREAPDAVAALEAGFMDALEDR